jgi:restriction endonuclease S subunit
MSTIALAEFCEIRAGGRKKWTGKDFVASGFPAYGAGGVNGYLPDHEFDRSAVVLSSIGARCGKCFIAEGRWSSLANTQLIFPDESRADPRFLWYQLNDEERWPRSGTGQPFIKTSHIKSHEVYLPSIEEQRRIAAVLDAADALRAKRRQAIAKLDSLTQAIFIDMFGDPLTNPKGALQVRLSELAEIINGDRGKNYPSSKTYVEVGVPFVNAGHLDGREIDLAAGNFISEERYERLRSGKFQPGDLLYCIRGSLGKIGVVPNQARGAIASSLVILRPGAGIDRDYLLAFLAGPAGMRQVADWDNGTAQPNLGAGSLGKFNVLLPSLAEQREFVGLVKRCADLGAQRQLAVLDTLFASLQQRAFRGEL